MRWLTGAPGVAIVLGVIIGACLGHCAAHADPIPLSRADLARVEAINLSVNAALPIRRPDGIGNCVQVSERKYQALSAFIPAHALHTVIVRAPLGRHQLTMIETTDGPIYLDMNSPWLETAKQARAMGYTIEPPTDWRRVFTDRSR